MASAINAITGAATTSPSDAPTTSSNRLKTSCQPVRLGAENYTRGWPWRHTKVGSTPATSIAWETEKTWQLAVSAASTTSRNWASVSSPHATTASAPEAASTTGKSAI